MPSDAPFKLARNALRSLPLGRGTPLCISVSSHFLLPRLHHRDSSNHLILCRPLLLLPSIFPSIRVFSNELFLCLRWPKYWSFSLSISPSNEYSGLIFRMDWLDLLRSKGLSRVFSNSCDRPGIQAWMLTTLSGSALGHSLSNSATCIPEHRTHQVLLGNGLQAGISFLPPHPRRSPSLLTVSLCL